MQYKFYVKDFEKDLYYKKGLYGNFPYNKYDYYMDKDYPSYFCMFDSTEVNNKLEYENMMLELEKGYSYDRKNVVLNGRCYSITYGEKPNIVTIQGGIGFPSNIKIDQPEYVELEPIDLSLEEYKNFLFKNKSIEGLKENRYIRKFKETTKLTPYMKDIIKDRAILDFEDGTPLSDDEALDWFSTEKDIPQELVADAANEIDFNSLVEMLVGDELKLIKTKEDYEFYRESKDNAEEAYKKFVKTFNWYAKDQGITLYTDIEDNTFGNHFYIKGNVEIKGRKIDNINEKEAELFYNLKKDLTDIYPIEFTDQIYLTQRYEIINGKEKSFFVLKLGSRKPFFDFKNILEELVDPENWNEVASNLAIKMIECILDTVGTFKY